MVQVFLLMLVPVLIGSSGSTPSTEPEETLQNDKLNDQGMGDQAAVRQSLHRGIGADTSFSHSAQNTSNGVCEGQDVPDNCRMDFAHRRDVGEQHHASSKQVALRAGNVVISPVQNKYQLTQLLGPLGADRPECDANSVVALLDTKNSIAAKFLLPIGTALPPLETGAFSQQYLPLPSPEDTQSGMMASLLPSDNKPTMEIFTESTSSNDMPLVPFSVASPNYRHELMISNPSIQNKAGKAPNQETVGDSKYRLKKRFGQGSCGEVWRARVVPKHSGLNEAHIDESGTDSLGNQNSFGHKNSNSRKASHQKDGLYILKRIFVERGKHVRLSGLREVFFGIQLRGQPHVARFVEYFEIVRSSPAYVDPDESARARGKWQKNSDVSFERELWLVFHDEGSSLHAYLYTQATNHLVQPSPFWQRMRTGGARGLAVLKEIMFQVLSGLSLIHGQNVTHRDIKPSNVIVRRSRGWNSGRPVLKFADFGSSVQHIDIDDPKHVVVSALYAEEGPSVDEETEKYQPPEVRLKQALHDAGASKLPPMPFDSDSPSSYDLWSTGVMFLEMILGTDQPFLLRPREEAVIGKVLSKHHASIRRAVSLLQGLEAYCVVPSTQDYNTWLSALRKPRDEMFARAHRAPVGRKGNKPTTTMAVGHRTMACGQAEILSAIRERDPLKLGLDPFGSDGKAMASLIGSLLRWNPSERISAEEAMALPWFGDLVPR